MIKINDPKRIVLAEKKKELIVFLDIDGVTANWTKGACKACDIDYDDLDVKKQLKKKDNVENIVEECDMWEKISAAGKEFWIELELFPWSKKLYNELKKKALYLSFLSSPAKDRSSLSGKGEWIDKHFQTDDFLLGKPKYLCANSNTLLIDDSEKKISKFEKHGGHVFLWPNPNKLLDGDIDADDTIKELLGYVDELEL